MAINGGKYLGYKRLRSGLHFRTAMINGSDVLVFQNGEKIGSGRITGYEENVTYQEIVEDIVTING